MQDYFDEIHKALKEFHEWNGRSTKLKPLYMLIKVDVDADIVYDQDKAEAYAENHCNSLEYALCDWYYPDDDSTHTLLNEEIHQTIDSYHQLLYNSWCNTTLD